MIPTKYHYFKWDGTNKSQVLERNSAWCIIIWSIASAVLSLNIITIRDADTLALHLAAIGPHLCINYITDEGSTAWFYTYKKRLDTFYIY